MSADDEWWAVERDPIEDALADCRNGHHGSGSVALAAEFERLRIEKEKMRVRWERAMSDGDEQAVQRLALHGEIRDLRARVAALEAVAKAARAHCRAGWQDWDTWKALAAADAALGATGLTASADHG